MDLVVEHDTTYTYAAPLRHSIQYLRLRPHQSALQTVWQWSVTGPEALTQFRDGFGNDVDVLAVTRPHQTFTVAVRGRVSTIDGDGLLPVESEVLPVEVFLRSTNLTAITPEIDDLARASAGGAKGIAAVESLIAAVAERVPYRGGLTNPATTAADALRVGGGVCQDHSHLLVACCRAVGIPARIILDDQQRSREEQAASLGFSAYAVTREDDPMSLAIQGLLDHSVEMDQRMLLILKEIF